MSERSCFISDCLVYFGDRQRAVAEAVVEHLGGGEIVEIKPGWLVVVGAVSVLAPNCEFEEFAYLPPFEHPVSVVVNCEGGSVIKVDLQQPKQFVIFGATDGR